MAGDWFQCCGAGQGLANEALEFQLVVEPPPFQGIDGQLLGQHIEFGAELLLLGGQAALVAGPLLVEEGSEVLARLPPAPQLLLQQQEQLVNLPDPRQELVYLGPVCRHGLAQVLAQLDILQGVGTEF